MNNEVNERLKQLKIEDFIWIIYVGIIFMSWYSNSIERNYLLNNGTESKEKYREIMIGIFIVLTLVYLYFLIDSYKSVVALNRFDSEKKKRLVILSFIGSLLIFISGLIFLYIAFTDEDLNVELAFN